MSPRRASQLKFRRSFARCHRPHNRGMRFQHECANRRPFLVPILSNSRRVDIEREGARSRGRRFLSLSCIFIGHSRDCRRRHVARISAGVRVRRRTGGGDAGDSERVRRRKRGKETGTAKNDSQLMSRRWAGELLRAKSGCDALLYSSPTASFTFSPCSSFSSTTFPLFFYLCAYPLSLRVFCASSAPLPPRGSCFSSIHRSGGG